MKSLRHSFLAAHKTAFALVLCMLSSTAAHAAAEYIGRDVCVQCHAEQVKLWQNSHHDLAMQHADDNTVLGDFSGVEFSHSGITSKFHKNKKKFMVRTDGPNGKLQNYEVKYTFGVYPLQQYLIELDNGRLQALTIAWDTRPEPEGGQRWFHLYPEEVITHTDELHWTRTNFNWNTMCAECHSTNLKKNYDRASNVFKSSWSEIDVSCEACHGPASEHIKWADQATASKNMDTTKGLQVLFDERQGVEWDIITETGSAVRSSSRNTEKEIEVCAQCHSRRSTISNDYSPGKPYLNHYMPRLLDEDMYFADGQIQDEVYVYGSFLQSKMYHAGVTCSDCHEPHSMQLRQEGNDVCLQCHVADKFDTERHHHHNKETTGALCAECHMPPKNYMVVDPRHDHSFRIPRPDLSVKLGIPNACNQCHSDKDATWSSKNIEQWYGKNSQGFQKFATALHAGREGKADAATLLSSQASDITTPDIARASAISLLPRYFNQAIFNIIQQGLQDKDAMVRMASVSALEGLQSEMLVRYVFPLLNDPVRSVRIEAARVLAPIPVGQLQNEQLAIYNKATSEYIDSQNAIAERPEVQLNLGNYYAAKGKMDAAVTAYKKAIELEDVFTPAYINLADLYRAQQKDAAAEQVLANAIEVSPTSADAHYSYGLLLIRQKLNKKAINMLQAAVELDSENAQYVYVYAVALNSTGKKDQAIKTMQDAHHRFPQNADILSALIAFHRDAGNAFAMQTYMKKLQQLGQ